MAFGRDTDVLVSQEAPLKILAQNLRTVAVNRSEQYPWRLVFPPNNLHKGTVVIEFSQVWLQGTVKSSSDDGDVIIINDDTGDIRVTKCSKAPGDRSWISPGSYCGILAQLKQPSKSPPEIEAIKLMHILETRNEAKSMWPLEVEELTDLLSGKIYIG